MPKADLETLFRSGSGGDRKIACETVLDAQIQLPPDKTDLPPEFPDYAAESFQIPADQEVDWYDRNVYYVRRNSTKGNFRSSSTTNPQFPGPKSNSSSQRGSIKSKASILGLPKLPDSGQLCRSIRRNCRPPSVCVAAKRAGRHALAPEAEPSSPRVSCLGRVRSKNRSRRSRSRREPAPEAKKPALEAKKPAKKKSGFWAPITGILLLGRGGRRRAARSDGRASAEPSARGEIDVGSGWISSVEAVTAPPGLGGMKRFSSGRRPPSWGGDEVEVGQGEHAPELR